MPTCEELYLGLHAKCQEIMVESFKEDIDGIHAKSHNFLTDLSKWNGVLQYKPEIELLDSALREYYYGLLAAAQGQYRQGFMALRLFVEQALAAVHFSANEL